MVVVGVGSTISRAPRRHDIRGSACGGEISVSGCDGIVGGHEPHFARRIVAGRDEDQAVVVRLADADGEAELLGLLVQRDVLVGRRAEPVIARAIAAPMVVDLGEDDARRCRWSTPAGRCRPW